MSTLISGNEFGLRRVDPVRVHQPLRAAANAPRLAMPSLLERLATWAERQPAHRRVGSHSLVALSRH